MVLTSKLKVENKKTSTKSTGFYCSSENEI